MAGQGMQVKHRSAPGGNLFARYHFSKRTVHVMRTPRCANEINESAVVYAMFNLCTCCDVLIIILETFSQWKRHDKSVLEHIHICLQFVAFLRCMFMNVVKLCMSPSQHVHRVSCHEGSRFSSRKGTCKRSRNAHDVI